MTILDILKNTDFRSNVINELVLHNNNYSIPNKIPILYKYCGFSEYALKNIMSNDLTISLISSFNDSYDSTLSFGNIKEKAIEEDKQLTETVGCKPILTINDLEKQLLKEQEIYKHFSDDSYCACFSESYSSTLMWSHYAKNNSGICIEYDFETIKNKLIYNLLFPVCYTEKPIDIYNYVQEKMGGFSIELGILISLLNKANCWKYEKEWRLIIMNELPNKRNLQKYINLENVITPKSIILGQNFLDNFILGANCQSKDDIDKTLSQLNNLANHAKKYHIPFYQMVSIQNSFHQTRKIVNIDVIIKFIKEYLNINYLNTENRSYIYYSFSKEINNKSLN